MNNKIIELKDTDNAGACVICKVNDVQLKRLSINGLHPKKHNLISFDICDKCFTELRNEIDSQR